MSNNRQLSLFSRETSDTTFSSICDILHVKNNTPAWPDVFGLEVRRWLKKNKIPDIPTLSLFSGAGGLDIGFSDVGFHIVSSVEIEKKFCETLKANAGSGKYFQYSHVNCMDICDFTGDNIGKVDFIIGGPPCQTFSAAGRRANGVSGTMDTRGVLFREYARLLNILSPKGFLFENVYGIIGAQGGRAWQEIREAFSNLGYRLYYRILDAADYGVPQHRERLIIVGLKEGIFKFPRPTHGPDSLDKTQHYTAAIAIKDVISRESDISNKLTGRYAKLLEDIPPGLNYSFYTEEMGHPNPIFAWRSKFSDFLYKADPDMPVRTIKASGGAYTGPLHWENRFFNYEEYKRLQTFPDEYQICGSKQAAVKQIENSVPPQLARILALAIREQVFETHFPFSLPLLEEFEELSFRKEKRKLTALYKAKADIALRKIKKKNEGKLESYAYGCKLHDNFFLEKIDGCAEFKVVVDWGINLMISVEDSHREYIDKAAEITIFPKSKKWSLPVEKVVITVRSMRMSSFTVAWKAFEQELMLNNIKDNIVQLNGYYQYTPKLICRCEFFSDIPYADIISSVVSGNNVGSILTTEMLAKSWKIEPEMVITVARYLKKLGYEVRNHSTNPQIANGSWLLPYAFPTLTPVSIQLRKEL